MVISSGVCGGGNDSRGDCSVDMVVLMMIL